MKLIKILLFMALLYSVFWLAAAYCEAAPPQACVQVKVNDKGGRGGSSGSGAVVRPDLVVTCWHVVQDRARDSVTVIVPGKGPVEGTVIRVDKRQDLAYIRLSKPQKPFKIGAPVRTGDRVTIHGYAYDSYKQSEGTINSTTYGTKDNSVQWREILDAFARSGDSGGPVLDTKGRFVGTLWGADKVGTQFTSVERIDVPSTNTTDYLLRSEHD